VKSISRIAGENFFFSFPPRPQLLCFFFAFILLYPNVSESFRRASSTYLDSSRSTKAKCFITSSGRKKISQFECRKIAEEEESRKFAPCRGEQSFSLRFLRFVFDPSCSLRRLTAAHKVPILAFIL
jgi:hypothetical protein